MPDKNKIIILSSLVAFLFVTALVLLSLNFINNPTPDPTADWKIFTSTPGNLSFKYPSSFISKPEVTNGIAIIQDFTDKSGKYTLSFSITNNYNQTTEKPYANIDEYINLPYQVKIIKIAELDGRQPLPRAGSENENQISFFSADKKTIYTINLKTGDSSLNTSEADITAGQTLFNQILSTFKFTNNSATQTLKIYYHDSKIDPEVNNCQANNFKDITLAQSSTPLTDALKYLVDQIQQENQTDYRDRVNQFELVSAVISDGIATLTFTDPALFTSGGSCRIGILFSQIEKTALQFSAVKKVIIKEANNNAGFFQP